MTTAGTGTFSHLREAQPHANPLPSAGEGAAGQPLVCWLQDCRKDSVPLVGGKCSSLGELINAGVRVPPGFALTTAGYRRFMADAGIAAAVRDHLQGVDMQDLEALEAASAR